MRRAHACARWARGWALLLLQPCLQVDHASRTSSDSLSPRPHDGLGTCRLMCVAKRLAGRHTNLLPEHSLPCCFQPWRRTGVRHTLQQMRPGKSCGQTSCSTCGMRRRRACSGDRQGALGAGVRAQERCSVRNCWREHQHAARWRERSSPSAIAVQGTTLESAAIDGQPEVSPS